MVIDQQQSKFVVNSVQQFSCTNMNIILENISCNICANSLKKTQSINENNSKIKITHKMSHNKRYAYERKIT